MGEQTFEQKIAAFWLKVNKAGPVPPSHPEMSNCWIWEGAKNHRNYGTFSLGYHQDGKQRNLKAHQVAFFIVNGYWPQGEIDHLCHVTLCVRPDHLLDVTHQENIDARRVAGLCHKGHRMEGDNRMPAGVFSGRARFRCRICYEAKRSADRIARTGGDMVEVPCTFCGMILRSRGKFFDGSFWRCKSEKRCMKRRRGKAQVTA